MKLIIAIIQDQYIERVLARLVEARITVTKLSSSGGFFKSGNTTLLIGVIDEKIELVDQIMKEVCHKNLVEKDEEKIEVSGASLFFVDVNKCLSI
ncbi:cyclic-di-AMP receptor [Peptoniphilus sp. GNH]|nr:hypothetical protein HMPREF3189_01095 [Clostridiales bacterium KA00134]UHR02509.1 cyclic-di-AMP receptor [Peptoniphilus sp. GNH]